MAVDHSWQTVLHPGETDDFFLNAPSVGFSADGDGFNPLDAWWLSELSRLIYKRDDTEGVATLTSRADHLARVGLVERRFFNLPKVRAALVETVDARHAAFAALVFRGTSGRLSNWLFNLDMAPYGWPTGGKVHRGFAHLIVQIWDAMAAVIDSIDKPLFFAGHSLGGALATLAASLHPPRAVYTFGAPRIGDAAFARSLSGVPVFNVINPRDIVTLLPPDVRGWRYCHVGTVIRNADLVPGHRPFGQAPVFLADHAPLNYTAQLPVAFEN